MAARRRATETKSPPQGDAAGSLHPSFKKGAQVLWHGKVAKIVNEPIAKTVDGTIHYFDLVIECDGEVLAVTQEALLKHQRTGGVNGSTPHSTPQNAVPKEPDWLTEKGLTAWRQFKKDADAVEATALGKKEADAPGGAALQERLLLDRLRNEDHASAVGEVWLRIERYFKKGDEGQRVVKRLLEALTLSKNTALMPTDYQRSIKRLNELKDFADQLYMYFTDGIARDPLWTIIAGSRLSNERDFRRMIASLRQIQLFLAVREEEFSHIFGQIGLTREINAAAAQRVVFSTSLSKAMHDIFGKWFDEVVRILTDIALETDTTIDQVKHARKIAARRRGRTEAPNN